MAETRTTRMRLVQWSEGTDSPQRVDFNETFLNIENSAVVYERGKFADRPNPSKSGYLYEATDQAVLYYSDGLVWTVLGSNTYSQFSRALNSGTPALITQGIANQSSDIFQVQTSDAVSRFRVRNSGDLISGPLTVQHASRPSSTATTAASDSGVTAEVATNVWALSAIVQAGNTTGILRAIRGGSTVFQVKADGALDTVGNVSIGGALSVSGKVSSQTAPSADTDMVRLKELRDYAAGNAVTAYRVNAGTGLTGGGLLDKDVTLGVVFSSNAGDGTASVAARQDHQHDLSGDRLTGTLPVSKGGTGVTTIAALQTALGTPPAARKILTGQGLSGGGDLTADRTISVNMLASGSKNGTDTNVARADHGHDLGDTNITGAVAVAKGGTGATTAYAARTNLGAASMGINILTGDGLLGGGDLSASRTLSVNFTGSGGLSGSATTVARSDHKHLLKDQDATGFYPKSTLLPTTQNLNTLTEAGIYSLAETSKMSLNAPVEGHWGYIEVPLGGVYGVQRFISTNTAVTYLRFGTGSGGWSAWVPQGAEKVVQPLVLGGWNVNLPGGGIIVTYRDTGQRRATMIGTLNRVASAFTHGTGWQSHGVVLPAEVRRTSGPADEFFQGQVEHVPSLIRIGVREGTISLFPSQATTINPGANIYFNATWWF